MRGGLQRARSEVSSYSGLGMIVSQTREARAFTLSHCMELERELGVLEAERARREAAKNNASIDKVRRRRSGREERPGGLELTELIEAGQDPTLLCGL